MVVTEADRCSSSTHDIIHRAIGLPRLSALISLALISLLSFLFFLLRASDAHFARAAQEQHKGPRVHVSGPSLQRVLRAPETHFGAFLHFLQ